jgi:hypothetical protein
MKNPEYFEPIQYEQSKGQMTYLPEKDSNNQTSGRFVFKDFFGKVYALDTLVGKLWVMKVGDNKRESFTPVPRNDEINPASQQKSNSLW